MYKQIKPLQEEGRMFVTPEESKKVQETLFEMGYKWSVTARTEVSRLEYNSIWLFWKNNNISWSTFGGHVNPKPLHIFTDYFTTEPLK